MVSEEPFNYHSRLWLPYYFEPNELQTTKMIAVKIYKWIHCADTMKDAISTAGFSASHQF